MTGAEIESCARETALRHGSARAALDAFGFLTNDLGDSEYRAALRRLIALEDGSAVSDCDQYIAVAEGEALTAWKLRKARAALEAKKWQAELRAARPAPERRAA